MKTDYLDNLNEPQRKAVLHPEGPLLVLAGAGSGKTRVITLRIRYLLETRKAQASEICAVTFTNKAAREMKERLHQLTGKNSRGLFIGTYHSLGLKILKENLEHLPLSENFSIMSGDDQLMIASEVLREFEIDNETIPEKVLIWNFSRGKNTGLSYHEISNWLDAKVGEPWGDLFRRYNTFLRNYNAVDFDDLILMPRDLLRDHADIRQKYHSKWRYFLADEFQDTNPLQFDLMRLLIPAPHNLCAVGDDDQSIYSWRGADISIILNYKKTFPNAEIVFLEQNYRSRQTILDLANATISNNPDRHPKKLWSARGTGEPADIFEAESAEDEAAYVCETYSYLHQIHNIPYSEMAILFRTNFQARPFEENLRRMNIPYTVVGGYQFYDRKEIRDVLAYLRFIANHNDERSLLRILNVPRRGIGDSSVQKLKKYATLESRKLWEVITEIEAVPVDLNAATLSALIEFRDFVKKYAHEFLNSKGMFNTALKMVEELDFEKEFMRQSLEEKIIQSKLMHIKELLNSIAYFEREDNNQAGEKQNRNLFQYLQYLSLMTDDERDEKNSDRVSLMTLHSAKGLEFNIVTLAGLMDGILPHKRSIESEDNPEGGEHSLEEERRLFYVGITRAKDKLFITYSRSKKSFGEEIQYDPSRFLSELPEKLLNWQKSSQEGGESSFDDMLKMLESL